MIKIEKNFLLDAETEKRLTEGAQFIEKKIIKDIYYDNDKFDVMTKDRWLRDRNSKFELKIPAATQTPIRDRELDKYEEITDEDKIREILGINKKYSLAEDLETNGFAAIASIITTRRTYKKEGFTIDLDSVDFDSDYRVAEIELIVENENGVEEVSNKIISFAKDSGLKLNPTHGKLVEYLRRHDQRVYQILIEAGVVWH